MITQEEESEQCIKLVRLMYGHNDAALRWQNVFITLCTNNKIGCIQSQADPCMLCKYYETGKFQLIVAGYVDNVLISDKEEEIYKFITTFYQTYRITDLGKLRRYLRIWYDCLKT